MNLPQNAASNVTKFQILEIIPMRLYFFYVIDLGLRIFQTHKTFGTIIEKGGLRNENTMQKNYPNSFVLLLFILVFTSQSCRKVTNTDTKQPTSFTELQVNKLFNFESFRNVSTSIRLGTEKSAGGAIVQIFDQNPANGGKLILKGAADSQGFFSQPLRLASRLNEVYVARVTAIGNNEYVAVPVVNGVVSFDFNSNNVAQKTVDTFCDCEEADVLPDNFNDNLTIAQGETRCVAAGNHATIKDLTIRPGAALKICGTASVNKYRYDSREGTIVVSPSGSLNLTKEDLNFTILNYGTINFSGNGTHNFDGMIENWGTIASTIKMISRGDMINHGTFTTTKEYELIATGSIVNNCKLLLTNNNDLKQNGVIENNGYIYVDGKASFFGANSNETTLGPNSLIEVSELSVSGDITGPATGNAQIKANDEGKVVSSAHLANFDLCSNDPDYSSNAGYTNMTYCTLSITVPDCEAFAAPEISSSLQMGGVAGTAVTPYQFTATGSEPMTFAVSGLPAGLSFNTETRRITGTSSLAGTYNATLTVRNDFGTDTETLVIIITQAIDPPVITSVLTRQATVNAAFSYTLTASGTGPITFDLSNLPEGLTFNQETAVISGSPLFAGTYNITLEAANAGGSSTETLVLTVGTPPTITNMLTATGTAGVQFSTFTITATGSPAITLEVSNLPQNLSFNPANGKIDGTPLLPGLTEVLILATNDFGSDAKTLTITINEGIQPPAISSALTASASRDFPFSYTIEASGSVPMTFDADNLPQGLTISGNVISGIPTTAGTFNITLSASNAAGTDVKTLQLTIQQASADDTDGDGIADALDDYPNDPDRAFNSYYPNQADFISIAFEDLWPAYGDYDFNDFVINLNYKTISNAQNKVVDIEIKYQIMADGASLDNGFGMVFGALPDEVEAVSGFIKVGNAVMLDQKGFEAGHTNETVVILIDNINPLMEGGMANTIPGGKYVQTNVQTVVINFSVPQQQLGLPPYNPFIFVDQNRSHEVHLKNQHPTEFADYSLFGTANDGSNPADNNYYTSITGLPWAIETPVNFQYPIESADMLKAHLKFAAWAQSSGTDFPDWYLDLNGYRDDTYIYVVPQ